MKFELRIFNGKNVKFKDYKTLRGIEKRVGGKMHNVEKILSEDWLYSPICYEGNDAKNNDKLTVTVIL